MIDLFSQARVLNMKVFVTGAAGFIGFHVSLALLQRGDLVVGLDSMNRYYDPTLKQARLDVLKQHVGFEFYQLNLNDFDGLKSIFEKHQFTHVINLAAQAGVRYSIEAPLEYIQSNLVGFGHILELSKQFKIQHFVYASSGSVSGLNQTLPSSIDHHVDHPMSLYAATKRSNELSAHAYSHLFALPTTGLRFFSVYGPYGRPDMALFLFTDKILRGESIEIFNYGNMTRDWTYIDDIRDGIILALDHQAKAHPDFSPLTPHPAQSSAPFKIYHLGRGKPVSLLSAVEELEKALGKEANKIFRELQAGDVTDTFAEIEASRRELGFEPKVDMKEGIQAFVNWYKTYYRI
jgi:UDP-glucuronate 4-epimerase